MKFIIYDPKTKLHKMLIESLCFELNNKYNIETLLINNTLTNCNPNILNNIDYKNDTILIILNPHFLKDCIEIKSDISQISLNFKSKILYITEPINLLIEKKVYEEFIKIIKPKALWTYTYENFNKINTYLKIHRVPPFFNTTFDFCTISLENLKNKGVDQLIFFGNINENRESIINNYIINKIRETKKNEIKKEEKSNIILNINDSWSKSSWQNILSKYLFYLNIHRRPNCKSFEALRIIPILYNGGVIFSAHCNKIEEQEYKEYNIYFLDESEIYDKYRELLQHINYDIIYQKTINFRNKNFDLDLLKII